MAPSQSRVAIGVLAGAACLTPTLFCAPSAPRQPIQRHAGQPQGSSARDRNAQSDLASMAIAGAGFAAMHAALNGCRKHLTPAQPAPRLGSMRHALPKAAGAATVVEEKPEVAAVPEIAEEPALPPPFDPSQQMGVTEPLGFFDPMGFTKVGDEKGFRGMQASEIKHGRTAMMASIGLLAQHYIRIPGGFFDKAKAGFGVMGQTEGIVGIFNILLVGGFIELLWQERDNKPPGNFGDPFGVNMYTDEMRLKEINNGRMAMISVFGIFAAEVATGKDAIQQFGLSAIKCREAAPTYKASAGLAGFTAAAPAPRLGSMRHALPKAAGAATVVEEKPEVAAVPEIAEEPALPPPFAPSQQMGVTVPLGFFDPMGFTKVGDEKGFRYLQASEIKHGRLAMMASIGLLAQHWIRLPGGFFDKAKAGFGVMGQTEGIVGIFNILLVGGFIELIWQERDNKPPGNFGDPFGVNMYTDEMRLKEINNGRMAMISVFGIFAAEVATGKDAIQQFGF